MAVSVDVAGLQFTYGDGTAALRNVSFSLDEGQVLCLLGPNGAGKSTLLRCILGLETPAAGRVSLGRTPIDALTRREIALRVAYVPQNTSALVPYSAFEVVLMGRTPHLGSVAVASRRDEVAAEAALAQMGITHLRHRSLDQMSGGERQLVMFARALCQEARLLVLDEPTASLDYGNQIRILTEVNTLRRLGHAVIMTAHNPDHALHVATHVGRLKAGELSALEPPHTAITSERMSELYGTAIAVIDGRVTDAGNREVRACVPLIEPAEGGPLRRGE
ncbi:MAG: ABC transporter ATP-binding protein [Vicinamibacterales bacterium]